ncbi:MAG: hypothetical protein J6Q82_08250 [Clostridia bacterium]|nr:hypothetical protein [Clostridia bacterium]
MGISPIRLFYLLLSSFFLGIGLGILYDVHRIIRVLFGVQYSKKALPERLLRPIPIIGRPLGKIRQGRVKNISLTVLVFLQDVFLMTVAGAGIVILNYAWNDGRFRIYTVVALFAGFLIYYFTLGKLVIYLSECIVFLLRATFSIFFFILSYPFVKTLSFLWKIIKRMQFNLQKTIANQRKKVYNIHKEKECFEAADRGFL